MLDISRKDVISTDIMDFDSASRFIKLPISHYLELLGIVSGGHYLTKGAVSISEQNQKSMIKGKIDLAYFYCCSYLLKSNGLCKSICSGNKILEEEFTSTAGVFNG